MVRYELILINGKKIPNSTIVDRSTIKLALLEQLGAPIGAVRQGFRPLFPYWEKCTNLGMHCVR